MATNCLAVVSKEIPLSDFLYPNISGKTKYRLDLLELDDPPQGFKRNWNHYENTTLDLVLSNMRSLADDTDFTVVQVGTIPHRLELAYTEPKPWLQGADGLSQDRLSDVAPTHVYLPLFKYELDVIAQYIGADLNWTNREVSIGSRYER